MIDDSPHVSPPLRESWIRGLARNPGTPIDVLLRLVDAAPALAAEGLRHRRELPTPLQEALLSHPSRRVRAALAGHVHVDPEIRNRLLYDADERVTMWALGQPGQRQLTDDMLTTLLAEIEDWRGSSFTGVEVRNELLFADRNRQMHRLSATHTDPRVRLRAAGFPSALDEPLREALLADPVPEVRAAIVEALAEDRRVMQPKDLPKHHCHAFWAVLQRPLSRALVEQVVAGGDPDALAAVARNPTTPSDVVQALLSHPAAPIRRTVAARTDLTPEQLDQLTTDPAAEVRTAVSVHPALSEQQRAAIAIDVTTDEDDGHYHRVAAEVHRTHLAPSLADALRGAGSVNPLLRRRAARSPELPGETVAALTDDPDLGVRVLLALNHPGAPPALLLRSFLEYDGCGRDQLLELPQFPVEGLARFAEHTDPWVRGLVARDPHADPTLIARLCTDPDAGVRQKMAECPRLPTYRLVALLDDAELAEHAAANPALPAAQMERILGYAA